MENKGKDKKAGTTVIWLLGGIFAAALIMALTGTLLSSCSKKETGKSFNLTGKETRPLLDPSMFTGMTRAAYAAAAQYPDMMNEVFCYCYCNEPPFRHKTLLSCFTDKHGAG